MNWYKVTTYPESDPTQDKVLSVVQDFSALSATKPYEPVVGMFAQTEFRYAEPFYFYFTPACQLYCPDLLKKYDAKECSKPGKSGVKFLSGHDEARNLLE